MYSVLAFFSKGLSQEYLHLRAKLSHPLAALQHHITTDEDTRMECRNVRL